MTNWTKETLTAHRAQMGWASLSDNQIDQVLAILNDAHETMESLEGVSWIEPDIRFSVATMCNDKSE